MKLTKQQERKFRRMLSEIDSIVESGRVKEVFPNMETISTSLGDLTLIKYEILTNDGSLPASNMLLATDNSLRKI